MTNASHFGRIMRERRVGMGMTLKVLAEKTGMSEKGLELIELGKSIPKLSSAICIAQVLNIDLGVLGENKPSVA